HALGEMPSLGVEVIRVLLQRLGADIDGSVEHQLMFALIRANQAAPLTEAMRDARRPMLQRRALAVLDQLPHSALCGADVLPLLDSPDSALAEAAATVAAKHKDWMPALTARFAAKLNSGGLSADELRLLETAIKPCLSERCVRELVAPLAENSDPECQQ